MQRWDIPERARTQIMLADRDVSEKAAELAHKQEELRMAQTNFQRVMNAVAGGLGIEVDVKLSDDGRYFFVPDVEAPPEAGQNGHQDSAAKELAASLVQEG